VKVSLADCVFVYSRYRDTSKSICKMLYVLGNFRKFEELVDNELFWWFPLCKDEVEYTCGPMDTHIECSKPCFPKAFVCTND